MFCGARRTAGGGIGRPRAPSISNRRHKIEKSRKSCSIRRVENDTNYCCCANRKIFNSHRIGGHAHREYHPPSLPPRVWDPFRGSPGGGCVRACPRSCVRAPALERAPHHAAARERAANARHREPGHPANHAPSTARRSAASAPPVHLLRSFDGQARRIRDSLPGEAAQDAKLDDLSPVVRQGRKRGHCARAKLAGFQ